MTHPVLSFKQLRSLTTTELRSHAAVIGAIPQSHGRTGLIDAIEAVQPTVIDGEPLSIDDEIELGTVEAPTVGSIAEANYDLICLQALEQLNARIISLDPDESDELELIEGINSRHCTFIDRDNRGYYTTNIWLLGNRYPTEEAAAIAYYEVEQPIRLFAALSAAKAIIVDRLTAPDYV